MPEENGSVFNNEESFKRTVSDYSTYDERETRTMGLKIIQGSDEWIVLGRKKMEDGSFNVAHGGVISEETLGSILVHLMANRPKLRMPIFQLISRSIDTLANEVEEEDEDTF